MFAHAKGGTSSPQQPPYPRLDPLSRCAIRLPLMAQNGAGFGYGWGWGAEVGDGGLGFDGGMFA